MNCAPTDRVRVLRDEPTRDGEYVLYWMIAARRTRFSYGLQHALAHAERLRKPLLVFEPLRVSHPFPTARIHRFVLDGMVENARAFAAAGVTYVPWVELEHGAGRGVLGRLAARACLVVTDDVPMYFLPRMVAAAAASIPVRMEGVDGDGFVPRAATDRAFTTAASFRRWMHKGIDRWAAQRPVAEPLKDYEGRRATPPDDVVPTPTDALADPAFLRSLPLDHDVPPIRRRGGTSAARSALQRFLPRVHAYPDGSRHPDTEGQSRLSPYLHFGHLGVHEVLDHILVGWSLEAVDRSKVAKREGFWGLHPGTETYLDELITWRELGRIYEHHHPGGLQSYDALPEFARITLAAHASDPRPWTYSRVQFEAAATHEPLWNACQRQLREEGVVQSYLRMLWGKMVLGWSADPREAFETLVHLNDRWAIDGRDPNGYSGISWCFGRFDRAWGPERPVFGKVRYMTCDASRKKLKMAAWAAKWGADGAGAQRRLW